VYNTEFTVSQQTLTHVLFMLALVLQTYKHQLDNHLMTISWCGWNLHSYHHVNVIYKECARI